MGTEADVRDNDLSDYFVAASSLRSTDPAIRRPAISVLLRLARGHEGPVQRRAERALVQEFGPYVRSEGIGACAAAAATVIDCCAEGRDCRTCEWLWPDALSDFDARAAFTQHPSGGR
jgi:hypothetical protein